MDKTHENYILKEGIKAACRWLGGETYTQVRDNSIPTERTYDPEYISDLETIILARDIANQK